MSRSTAARSPFLHSRSKAVTAEGVPSSIPDNSSTEGVLRGGSLGHIKIPACPMDLQRLRKDQLSGNRAGDPHHDLSRHIQNVQAVAPRQRITGVVHLLHCDHLADAAK